MTDPTEIPAFFYDLAPVNLPIQRADRYSGDQMSATLSDLREPDQAEVRRLYAQVEEAQDRLLRSVESPVLPAGIAAEVAGLPLWSEIVDTTRRVNAGGSGYDERMRRVLHDVRGGSLTALLGTAQMLPYSGSLLNDLHRCAYYARDHLKTRLSSYDQLISSWLGMSRC